MANIFGPGLAGDQSVSSRPTQLSTGLGTDQWFQDCTSEAAQDGTRVRAQFMNFIIANFREAVRGLGVTESETDDQLLLKCFQQFSFAEWLNLPVWPEITEAGNVLSYTTGSGTITINSGQNFVHRGWNEIDTSDYSAGERTVSHSASKTYHLRWQYNSGSPQFVLKDLSDGAYNPGSDPEHDAAFDSTYDDMLIALVETDAGNSATVTQLQNKHQLSYQTWLSPYNGPSHYVNITSYAWARTPTQFLAGQSPPGVSLDSDYATYAVYVRRTITRMYGWTWHHNFSATLTSQRPGMDVVLKA